jgi:hypothetical protein
MYTEEMAEAFHAITPPQNFGVTLIDFDKWIDIIVDTEQLMALSEEDRVLAAQYAIDVARMLDDHGAIVQIVREAIDDKSN